MESTCHRIGSDIAGTNYDVAHVKWGDSWVMPSYSQFKELIENCTTEWTSLNGINGYKFTGPNGSSIFLPASGYYGFGDKFFEGSAGLFWSSTYNSSNKDLARYLRFDSGRLTLDYYLSRNSGQPVRAVCVEDEGSPLGYEVYYKQVAGQYTGNMYAIDFKNSQKGDTLIHAVTATVTTDPIITFSEFPLYFIIKELSDVDLREAVMAKGNTDMMVKYTIYSKDDNYLYTYIIPQSVIIDGIDYKGGKHKLTVSFVYPSQGFFYSLKYIQVSMYIGGVYLDDVLLEDLVNNKTAPQRILQFQGNIQ